MLGIYDYTVLLTYGSLISAVIGLFFGVAEHPLAASICLMLCGLMDAFDGIVARTKKDRSEEEKRFGIQIDSLTDLIAFGVLPCGIGYCLYTQNAARYSGPLMAILCLTAACGFVLAAMIRLSYFNVQEEIRQQETSEKRAYYTGMPVTVVSLYFPLLVHMHLLWGGRFDMLPLYAASLAVFGILFLTARLHVRKASPKAIGIAMVLLAAELVLFLYHRLA